MARGPFSPVEQREVGATKLVAESLPASAAESGAGIFDAISKGAGALVEQNRTRFEKGIKDELRSDLNATELGLAAIRDPNILKSVTDAAAEGNPFFQKAKQEFLLIADAVKQGRLPSTSATVRTKAVLAASLAENPEFSDELRAEAKAALGFSPEAQTFRNLLREPKPLTKTATQKLQEEVDAAVNVLGVPESVVVAARRNDVINKAELQMQQVLIGRGNIQANQASFIGDLTANEATNQISSMIQSQIAATGGVSDPIAFKQQANASLGAIRAQTLQNLGPFADPKVRSTVMQQFDNHAKNINRMIDDGSLVQVYQEKNELVQAMVMNNILKIPELAAIHTLVGKEGMLEYVTVLSKGMNSTQLDILAQSHKSLAGLRNLGDYGRALSTSVQNQANGIPAANDQERVLRSLFNLETIKTGSKGAAEAVDKMEAEIGAISTLKTSLDPIVIFNTKNDPKLREKFTNLLTTEVVATKQTIQGIVDQFGDLVNFDGNIFSVVQPSTEELEAAVLPGQAEPSIAGFTSSIGLDNAIERANTLLEVGRAYQDAGIIEFDASLLQPTAAPERVQTEQGEIVLRWNPELGDFEEVK